MNYNVWIKNLPKNMRLPRARYDSRNLLKDINININLSGFNFSPFVPTAPIRQPRQREYVDPRYEIPPTDDNDIFTNFAQVRRAEIDAENRAPQMEVEEILNPTTNRWNNLNTQHGRRIMNEHPTAQRRYR